MKVKSSVYYDKAYFANRDYDYNSKYQSFVLMAQYLVEKYHPKRTLDIGFGKGAFFVKAMHELNRDAYGVDFSEYAIAASPKDLKNRLYQVDVNLENLTFENDTFDMITAFRLFEHIENITHLIGEIKRVLVQNGIVFITVPTLWNIKKGNILRAVLPSFKKILPNLDRPSLNCSVLTHREWIRHFEKFNFVYLGGLPQSLWKKVVSSPKPATKIGYILKRSGLNSIRGGMAFRFDWFTPFVFMKKT